MDTGVFPSSGYRPLQTAIEDDEGTNALYKLAAASLLLWMNHFRSTRFSTSMATIGAVHHMLQNDLDSTRCLTADELLAHRLLKRKHYYYGAYLSALTSLPILSSAGSRSVVFSSMVAKTLAITSIKVLDNIHDKLLSRYEAAESQRRHLEAFTAEPFDLTYQTSFLGKAENSCMKMARWTYELVADGLSRETETSRIYFADFADYIEGQIGSFDEKIEDASPATTIQDYIRRVNEKSVGRIWVDIDFCFLEKALGRLRPAELQAVLNVRRAADYFFKGCNLYDDVADLEEDLKLGIFSSVPLLALDRGLIRESDLRRNSHELLNMLKQSGAIDEAVELADLIFLHGMKPLEEAKRLTEVMDIDAIVFGAKILRMFAIRKWLIHERSLNSLCRIAISLGTPEMYHISEPIVAYSRYI
ncbi:MAG: hypothetical protein QXT81_02865 [Candidatus Bathyarchaeia archaeon]